MDCDERTCLACKDKLLTRKGASMYFSSVKGVKIASSTLAKCASTGEGPDFVKFGRTVYYRVGEIDCWLDRKLVRQGCALGLSSVAPHAICCKILDVSIKKSKVEAYLDS